MKEEFYDCIELERDYIGNMNHESRCIFLDCIEMGGEVTRVSELIEDERDFVDCIEFESESYHPSLLIDKAGEHILLDSLNEFEDRCNHNFSFGPLVYQTNVAAQFDGGSINLDQNNSGLDEPDAGEKKKKSKKKKRSSVDGDDPGVEGTAVNIEEADKLESDKKKKKKTKDADALDENQIPVSPKKSKEKKSKTDNLDDQGGPMTEDKGAEDPDTPLKAKSSKTKTSKSNKSVKPEVDLHDSPSGTLVDPTLNKNEKDEKKEGKKKKKDKGPSDASLNLEGKQASDHVDIGSAKTSDVDLVPKTSKSSAKKASSKKKLDPSAKSSTQSTGKEKTTGSEKELTDQIEDSSKKPSLKEKSSGSRVRINESAAEPKTGSESVSEERRGLLATLAEFFRGLKGSKAVDELPEEEEEEETKEEEFVEKPDPFEICANPYKIKSLQRRVLQVTLAREQMSKKIGMLLAWNIIQIIVLLSMVVLASSCRCAFSSVFNWNDCGRAQEVKPATSFLYWF